MSKYPTVQSQYTLVIAGDTLHYCDDDGNLYTHAALASQLDIWAGHFDQVRFCGVLGAGPPPKGFSKYGSQNLSLVELRGAGGTRVTAKLKVVWVMLSWILVLAKEFRGADAVHLRTPCNITIPGILLARLFAPNRYAIYAGSWDSYEGEALTYRLQRWLLQRVFGGIVHAYLPTSVTASKPNLRPGFSPVLTNAQLDELSRNSEIMRCDLPEVGAERPIRLVCVGRFSANKNQTTLIDAIRTLTTQGIRTECIFIGNGAELEKIKYQADGLEGISFRPAATHQEVFAAMSWADLNVLPSFREGFPKVLLEGMSVGALPIAADTPVNRSMVETHGWIFNPASSQSLASCIQEAIRLSSAEWHSRRADSLQFAKKHTLDAFDAEVNRIVSGIWGIQRTHDLQAALDR